MLGRCENEKDPRFASYGGRGIRVCKRWHVFINFFSDVGQRPAGKTPGGRAAYTLDRIDNDGDYKPSNVRWLYYAEQSKNQTRNRRLTLDGRSMILADWARELGVSPGVIQQRFRRGDSLRRALRCA